MEYQVLILEKFDSPFAIQLYFLSFYLRYSRMKASFYTLEVFFSQLYHWMDYRQYYLPFSHLIRNFGDAFSDHLKVEFIINDILAIIFIHIIIFIDYKGNKT
jgi:hypothetical protein